LLSQSAGHESQVCGVGLGCDVDRVDKVDSVDKADGSRFVDLWVRFPASRDGVAPLAWGLCLVGDLRVCNLMPVRVSDRTAVQICDCAEQGIKVNN